MDKVAPGQQKGKSGEIRTVSAKGSSPLVGSGCKYSWAKHWGKFSITAEAAVYTSFIDGIIRLIRNLTV